MSTIPSRSFPSRPPALSWSARPHDAGAVAGLKEPRFFRLLLALAVIELWILPAASSLWLDETATFWMIKDGPANAVARSMYWAGQSPVYYLTAWLAMAVGGRHELILRLPSIAFMIGAAVMFYRLAARLFDGATAWLAVAVFACSEQVIFAAADARPYAFGLCMLIGSALMLARWLDTGRKSDAAGYALLAALTLYAHFLFAPALLVLALYAAHRVQKERLKPGALAAAWAWAGLMTAPLVAQTLRFYQTRTAHSFAETPRFSDLLATVAPPVLVASLAVGLLIAWLACPPPKRDGEAPKEAVLLAAGWAVLPPLVCYLISVTTDAKLFVPRYFIACQPGLALLAAWIVRKNAGSSGRRVVGAALFLGAALSFGTVHHNGEDWAGAMQAVRSEAGGTQMPVLVASGFVEASDPQALDDPKLQGVLFAPQEMYPAAGKLIRLPYRLDEKSIPYLEGLLSGPLAHERRFLLVCRWQGLTFEPWLRGRGFRSESLGNFGGVGVFRFSR